MENAPKRWAERVSRGLSDEQLTEALQYELGQFGASSTGNLGLTYQGNGLKIWADHCVGTRSRPPILEGQATLRLAREVYGIADPADKQMGLF
jgi:hypothetical protein